MGYSAVAARSANISGGIPFDSSSSGVTGSTGGREYEKLGVDEPEGGVLVAVAGGGGKGVVGATCVIRSTGLEVGCEEGDTDKLSGEGEAGTSAGEVSGCWCPLGVRGLLSSTNELELVDGLDL